MNFHELEVPKNFQLLGPVVLNHVAFHPNKDLIVFSLFYSYLIALSLQEENRATDAQTQVPMQAQQQQLPPPLTAEQQEANE